MITGIKNIKVFWIFKCYEYEYFVCLYVQHSCAWFTPVRRGHLNPGTGVKDA